MSIYDYAISKGLNGFLAASQGISEDDIDELFNLHLCREAIMRVEKEALIELEGEALKEKLKELAWELTEIEYHMQDSWKFPRDKDHHRYSWDFKSCNCPREDNLERTGLGIGYYVSQDCPIHS